MQDVDGTAGERETARFPFFDCPPQGARAVRPAAALEIPTLDRAGLDDPSRYRPHRDLVNAVNTALLLGMPLLVTGEPGCGKTQLGEALAHQLGLDRPEKFETKSTSQARDALYEFDVVGRFNTREAASGALETDPRFHIAYAALGKAILLAHPRDEVAHLLPTGPGRLKHPGSPRRIVVIIDEVDKAPRDFPNDLLNEIDRMYFRVPELGAAGIIGTPGADDPAGQIAATLRPIVIFTSNSEKKLPEAFLRRCVYFNIPRPDPEQLRQIIEARLESLLPPGRKAVEDALAFYYFLRQPRRGLTKVPGVAELLNWVQALAGHPGIALERGLAEQEELVRSTLTTILKTEADQSRARPSDDGRQPGLLREWINERE